MAAMSDPYFIVRDEVDTFINQAEQLLMDAGSMRSASPVQESAAKKKVSDVIDTIQSHLEDLDMAVVAVENNPAKFGISTGEAANRRRFVESSRDKAQELRSRLKALDSTRKVSFELDNPITRSNDDFISNEQTRMMDVMREQDQGLDELGESISRLGNMSRTIGEELDEQAIMLDDLEESVDRTQISLEGATKKAVKLLKTNGSCQIGTIAFLVIALAVLLYLTFA